MMSKKCCIQNKIPKSKEAEPQCEQMNEFLTKTLFSNITDLRMFIDSDDHISNFHQLEQFQLIDLHKSDFGLLASCSSISHQKTKNPELDILHDFAELQGFIKIDQCEKDLNTTQITENSKPGTPDANSPLIHSILPNSNKSGSFGKNESHLNFLFPPPSLSGSLSEHAFQEDQLSKKRISRLNVFLCRKIQKIKKYWRSTKHRILPNPFQMAYMNRKKKQMEFIDYSAKEILPEGMNDESGMEKEETSTVTPIPTELNGNISKDDFSNEY